MMDVGYAHARVYVPGTTKEYIHGNQHRRERNTKGRRESSARRHLAASSPLRLIPVAGQVVLDSRGADVEIQGNGFDAAQACAEVGEQSGDTVAQTRTVLENALPGICYQEVALLDGDAYPGHG
jgi:hypothetical protein